MLDNLTQNLAAGGGLTDLRQKHRKTFSQQEDVRSMFANNNEIEELIYLGKVKKPSFHLRPKEGKEPKHKYLR